MKKVIGKCDHGKRQYFPTETSNSSKALFLLIFKYARSITNLTFTEYFYPEYEEQTLLFSPISFFKRLELKKGKKTGTGYCGSRKRERKQIIVALFIM